VFKGFIGISIPEQYISLMGEDVIKKKLKN